MYLWEVFLIKKYNNSKLERRQIIKFLPKKWSVAFTQYLMLTYFYSTFWRSDLRTWSVSRTHAHQKNLFRWNLSLSLTQRFKKFSISYFLWGILTKTLTTKKMGLRSNPRRTFFSLSLLSILVFLLFTSFALAQVSLSLSLSLSLYMHICGVCWWLWLSLLWILGVRAWYWQGRVYWIQRSGSP